MQKDATSLTIASALPALFRLSTNSFLLLVPFFSRIEVHRSLLASRLAAVAALTGGVAGVPAVVALVTAAAALSGDGGTAGWSGVLGAHSAGDAG